jgi:uncharacterized damage-inducible protein DinB
MANTKKMLAVVPDGKSDWKPHPKSMSLGQLSTHVAELPTWGKTTLEMDAFHMKSGDYKPTKVANTAELLALFDKNVSEARALLTAASDEKMLSDWSMTWDDKPVMKGKKIEIFRGTVLNHMIHHRGQLSVFLLLLEVEIPGMYGPSADEMKYWS